jgi:hypothetical protein
MCELTCPASVSSSYRAELHEGCFHSAYQSQTEQQLSSIEIPIVIDERRTFV